MTLPLIDLFETSYEDDYYDCKLSTAYQAATHAAKTFGCDQGLSFHTDDALKKQCSWLSFMPKVLPDVLDSYQCGSSFCSLNQVSEAINLNGCLVTAGQFLFHGGKWPVGYLRGAMFETIRPLSTTLCPNIAMGVPQFHGRAYQNNALDLFVLRVRKPRIKAFFFDHEDTDSGHEKELVFSRGVKLTLVSCKEVRTIPVSDFVIGSRSCDSKDVPLRVLEVDLS